LWEWGDDLTDNAAKLPPSFVSPRPILERKFLYIFKDLTKEVVRDLGPEHGEGGYVACFSAGLETNPRSDACISNAASRY
jgi:hypothetical protein